LTAEYATLLAEEFGRNPIVSDEASFDLYPSLVTFAYFLMPPHLSIFSQQTSAPEPLNTSNSTPNHNHHGPR
jgi:hypothetical protein